jgi:hypothetical protein
MQATPDQLGAYFLWLKDRGLRFPVRAVPATPRKRVQVAFVGDTGFTPAERDLLHKMIAAMQLTGEHAIIDQLEDFPGFVAGTDAELVIPLGKAAAEVCPGDTIPTLHPRDLLARPEDKRIAWNDLKRAMARLKS